MILNMLIFLQFYVYYASGESMDEFLKVPCILHMDSIRGSHTGLKDLFQRYLNAVTFTKSSLRIKIIQ